MEENALLSSKVRSCRLVGDRGKTEVTQISPGCSEGRHNCTSGTNDTSNLEAPATLLGTQYLQIVTNKVCVHVFQLFHAKRTLYFGILCIYQRGNWLYPSSDVEVILDVLDDITLDYVYD